MAQITAQLIKQLREMTDSPMVECKKALQEADGDIEKAVDVLRTMGVAKAVKKAGRDTNEGTVGAYVSEDGKVAALVEVSCETDFVGSNPKFTGFVAQLAKVVAESNPSDIDDLKTKSFDGSDTVDSALTELIHTMAENMKIARFVRHETSNGGFSSYIHGSHLADIVEFSFSKADTFKNAEFSTFAHDVAMQVAAANPVAATRDDVPAETLQHEREIYLAQAAESGKPEFVQEKMVEGRVEKYMKEFVLTEQEFIKDSSKTINSLASEVSKSTGDEIKVVSFDRYAFGE